MSKLSDQEILNVVRSERDNSIGTSQVDSELGKQRSQAIDYYHGKMDDFPPLPGWSKVTTRDVFQTIESAMPDILEIFASSEDIMEFLPEDEADVDKARQETDVVNHVFHQENNGFLVLYTFIKDALQAKNGFVKVWWEDRETDEEEHYFNQDDEALAVLRTDDDIEITDVETTTEKTGEFETINTIVDGELVAGKPEEVVITSHDVVAKRSKDVSGVKIQALPPEEVAVSRETLDLQNTPLVRHIPRNTTRSHLLEIGISEDKVKSLNTIGNRNGTETEEELARDTLFQDDLGTTTPNWSMQFVDVADNYIRMDINGNGKQELWHVMTGDKDTILLSKTRIDRVPISTMTPIIEPHQIFGLSLADLVMDLQRITTFLTRSALDNAAAMNNQRPIISASGSTESTIDDVLMNRPGSPIMVNGDARAALTYAPNNNIAPDMIGLVQYFDTVKTERTGITRFGQDMDPNAVQKDRSATEFAGQRSDALKTLKLIARIFAETGIKDMMINIHQSLQAHSGNKERAFRLNGKFEQVNPREWRTRSDMQVNVGLGTGTKAEQIAQLAQILEQQKIAWAEQGGQDGPLVTLKQIRYTLKRIIELQGFKTADAFFEQIDDEQPQEKPEPAPDPALVKVQMDAKNDAEKNQIAQQKNMMDAQITNSNNEQKLQLEAFKITQELELKARELGLEFSFKTELARAELMLKNKQIEINETTEGVKMGVDFAERANSIGSGVNIGGDIAG